MTRLVRRVAALLATFALVFAQMAVSAYACPREAVPEVATSGVSGEDLPCADLQSPNLCDRHCAYGSSATGQAPSASLPPFVATVRPWRLAEPAAIAVFAQARDDAFLHFEPPPPLLLFGALRI